MEAKTLIEILERCDLNPQSYSGRGMYGRHCVGVVTNHSLYSLALKMMYEAGEIDGELTEDGGTGPCTYSGLVLEMAAPKVDNMGKDDIIVYWPNIEWADLSGCDGVLVD